MRKLMLIALLQSGASSAQPVLPQSCAKEVGATAVVERLSELPPDIRDDLLFRFKDMGDRGSPLLQTDAPSAVELSYPTSRFAQALLIKNVWFVQFEVSMFSGVRTVGYVRGSDGRFTRSPSRYFGGPACATLRAAVSGVYNPGLFNF